MMEERDIESEKVAVIGTEEGGEGVMLLFEDGRMIDIPTLLDFIKKNGKYGLSLTIEDKNDFRITNTDESSPHVIH